MWYKCICCIVYTYTYIYIYIERERYRERQRDELSRALAHHDPAVGHEHEVAELPEAVEPCFNIYMGGVSVGAAKVPYVEGFEYMVAHWQQGVIC